MLMLSFGTAGVGSLFAMVFFSPIDVCSRPTRAGRPGSCSSCRHVTA
jgi:hypothetical protein